MFSESHLYNNFFNGFYVKSTEWYLFFLSGLSFTNIYDSQDSRGKGMVSI